MEESNDNESVEAIKKDIAISQPYPWLALCDGDQRKRQIFYSITEDRYHIRFIPDLHLNSFITSSNKKWLVIQDFRYYHFPEHERCYLLNISTMEKLLLPRLEGWLLDYPICVLSSSSSKTMDDTCRIVLISPILPKLLSCYLGDTEFTYREVTVEGESDHVMVAINFNGKLFAYTVSFDLVSADFSDPLLIFKPLIYGQPLYKLLPTHDEMKNYLVECCGDLLLVYTRFRDHELTDLKIIKADLINREWVRVKNLGDQAIFLDSYNSFSSPASRFGLRGNCVYLLNKRGRNLSIFDLEDQTISTSLPCPIAKSNSSLFWMAVSKD